MRIPLRKLRALVLALVLALVGGIACGSLVDPPLPDDGVVFVPPAVYAKWWAMVEACSGQQGAMDDVEWYVTPTILHDPHDSDLPIDAYWSLKSNRIVLNTNDTIAGAIVRHEMLHALVQRAGHPRSAFLQSCGGVVFCGSRCVADAGLVIPPANAEAVDPSQLEVTTSVSPAIPSPAIDGGLALFTISVHNPLSHAIKVNLPAKSGGGITQSFGYDMRTSAGPDFNGGEPVLDPGIVYFAAGETKVQLIDFFVIPPEFPSYQGGPGLGEAGIALPVGSYTFTGNFGGKAAAPLAVTLSP